MTEEAPPPGRTVRYLNHEQLQLVLVAIDGLAAHLRGEFRRTNEGSPRYHSLAHTIGQCTTIGNQLRRQIAAHEQTGQGDPDEGLG